MFIKILSFFFIHIINFEFSVQWPLNVDFSNPESVGMKGTRNFYLTTDQQVKIGLWLVIKLHK